MVTMIHTSSVQYQKDCLFSRPCHKKFLFGENFTTHLMPECTDLSASIVRRCPQIFLSGVQSKLIKTKFYKGK